jgi:hypothetical protein
MTAEKAPFKPIEVFLFEGQELPVEFIETIQVIDGVECDVYRFVGDNSRDLGIIRISPGKHTPLQRVLKGNKTIEGYISGKGRLEINGKTVYIADGRPISVIVNIDETMQWFADDDSSLTAYEICYPPYEDGRYENISE